MRYLIITKDNQPFYTNWFDFENFYNPELMDCIFDFLSGMHTFNGVDWVETKEDNL